MNNHIILVLTRTEKGKGHIIELRQVDNNDKKQWFVTQLLQWSYVYSQNFLFCTSTLMLLTNFLKHTVKIIIWLQFIDLISTLPLKLRRWLIFWILIFCLHFVLNYFLLSLLSIVYLIHFIKHITSFHVFNFSLHKHYQFISNLSHWKDV